MNKIAKAFLLVAVLVFGATCVQARDHGPSDGVQITRAIVHGIAQILSPRPVAPPPPRWAPPPPPPRRWTPPPPPRRNPPPPPHMGPRNPPDRRGGPPRR